MKVRGNSPLPQNGEYLLNKGTDIVRNGEAKNRGRQGACLAGFLR